MANNLTIITYHYVRELDKKYFPHLKILELKKFIKQIKHIKKKYKVLSFSEINEYLKNKQKFPKNSCWLTFDDGYKDHIKNVLPILIKNKLYASFFPTVTYNKKKKLLNTNKIQILLATGINENEIINYIKDFINYKKKKFNFKKFNFYEKKFKFKNQFDNINISFIKNLLQHGLPFEARETLIDELFKKKINIDEEKIVKNFYLNEKDIYNLLDNGMHIGGHGYGHLKLGKLDIANQTKEIRKTYNFLKKLYGKKEDFVMCYPFGSYNENTIEILKKFNFKMALTTNRKIANFERENIFELSRLDTNDIII